MLAEYVPHISQSTTDHLGTNLDAGVLRASAKAGNDIAGGGSARRDESVTLLPPR